MKHTLMLLLVPGLAAAGCASPEASRTRGGGPGADLGNRASTVLMHEGSREYWETPELIPSEHPPLGPSEHARQRSLP